MQSIDIDRWMNGWDECNKLKLCHSTVNEQKLGMDLGSSEFWEWNIYTWWLLSIISSHAYLCLKVAHGFCARFWRTSSLLATIVYTKLRTIVHSCHHHIYNISWAFFLSCLYKNLWILRQYSCLFSFSFSIIFVCCSYLRSCYYQIMINRIP
jgi:hypothetical protein